MWDLLLKGGQVIDPVNNINDVMDVAIEGGKIAAVGKDLVGRTKAVDRYARCHRLPFALR